MNLPKELKYNDDYSWIKIEKDIAVIGLIEPAAKNVEEFVFIDLPKKNINIKKGDVYVSVEAIKWSGHLTSPLSGKIIEVNDSLFDEPSMINENPYESWIVKIKISNKKELDDLISSSNVEKLLEQKLKK